MQEYTNTNSQNTLNIEQQKENKKTLKELQIIEHLKKSEEEIENGKTIPAKILFEELKEEYKYEN